MLHGSIVTQVKKLFNNFRVFSLNNMASAWWLMAFLWALPSGFAAIYLPNLALMALLPSDITAITCYVCSSYGGLWGCLAPFDYQPIVR